MCACGHTRQCCLLFSYSVKPDLESEAKGQTGWELEGGMGFRARKIGLLWKRWSFCNREASVDVNADFKSFSHGVSLN